MEFIAKAKIGSNRGLPRVWLEKVTNKVPTWPLTTRYNVEYGSTDVSLTPTDDGKRKLAAPSKGGVIDINTAQLDNWLDEYEERPTHVRISLHKPTNSLILEPEWEA